MIGELLSEVCGRVGLGFVLAWFELCVLLKLWKTVAGKLLKCVRTVNSIELAAHDLGEKYHKASSEPLFCETAYLPVKGAVYLAHALHSAQCSMQFFF